MPLSDADQALLLRAVALAEQSIGLSDPNPRVGCVLHTADGQLAGEGFTQQAGGPHAEVMALRDAATAARPVVRWIWRCRCWRCMARTENCALSWPITHAIAPHSIPISMAGTGLVTLGNRLRRIIRAAWP